MGEDARAAVLTSWTIAHSRCVATCPAKARAAIVHAKRRRTVRVVPAPHASPGARPWPAATDQWCWHCCHPFSTQPLPMPMRHDSRRDVFHVGGTFCSWACMKTHNWESSSHLKTVIVNNISLFHWRCTGTLGRIRPAPPKQALAVFGGTMSIEEFRAASDAPVEYTILPDNMVHHHQVVQEVNARRLAVVAAAAKRPPPDLAAMVNFKDVSAKNETLRLKRPKPPHNSRNLLERTMGIGVS